MLLVEDDKNKNKTARLNEIFDDIEVAIKKGISRKSIWETLAKNG